MTPRYGRPPLRRTYIRRPGIYAILPRGRSVLLTHQAEPRSEFQLPGGGIDPGEHPLPALIREVREETGWSIARARRVGCYRRFTFMPDYDLWAEKICHIYIAHPVRRLHPPSEPGHNEVWMEIGDALKLVESVGDRAFLARVLGSRPQ